MVLFPRQVCNFQAVGRGYARHGTEESPINRFLDASIKSMAIRKKAEYRHFITSRQGANSLKELYHLMAFTPLSDPQAPVDYVSNLRRVFAHTQS